MPSSYPFLLPGTDAKILASCTLGGHLCFAMTVCSLLFHVAAEAVAAWVDVGFLGLFSMLFFCGFCLGFLLLLHCNALFFSRVVLFSLLFLFLELLFPFLSVFPSVCEDFK